MISEAPPETVDPASRPAMTDQELQGPPCIMQLCAQAGAGNSRIKGLAGGDRSGWTSLNCNFRVW